MGYGDSGTTSHMLKKSCVRWDTNIMPTTAQVQTASSKARLIPLGRADIGSTYKGALVFEDHELAANLISIPRLDSEGCTIMIENSKMTVTKNGKLIMQGKKEEGGLYQFNMRDTEMALLGDVTTPDRLTTLQRNHNVLGHRNLLRISKYIRENKLKMRDWPPNVSDREITSMPLCDACVKAKMTKRRIHRIEPKGPQEVGAYLSTDMKGPFRLSGVKGERLYQGFLDGASKYLICECFEYKSAAPNNLRKILGLAPFKDKLQRYHADGAPELISKETIEILQQTGATASYSAPYTSTDNAAIERSHRTIFESAHALLLHACLPMTYWCYAVDHAVYIYNRIPTNTAYGYMTPRKAAFNIDSELDNEKTFGANCYGIIPQESRLKGFTDKGYKAIYLGHRKNDAPGYYLLLVESNIIKECSHVTFDESDLDTGERARRQTVDITLEVDPVPRNTQDYQWLIGMAYRDENILYMTTRVVAEGRHKFLVAYRGVVHNNKLGAEEERPLHVADVVSLTNTYLKDNSPLISTEGRGLCRIDGEGVKNSVGGSNEEISQLNLYQASARKTQEVEPLTSKGSMPGDDGPIGAVGSMTTASRRKTPPRLGQLSGETDPARDLLAPIGSMSLPRTRAQRVPLNIGVMGDVEKVFSITDYDTEYIYTLSNTGNTTNDTLLYSDVIGATSQREEWMTAAREELISIVRDNDVWEVADLPAGKKALTTKWLFKLKKSRGKPDRYKGRLCVRGFEQQQGVDYWETYAPTAKWVTLRLFLSICACLNLHTRQLDVKTAFLYADLDEEIYIECPKGVNKQNPFGLPPDVWNKCKGNYLRLKKSLYGLKQAPRNWFTTLKTFLIDQGFSAIKSESCIFVKWTEGRICWQ